MAEERVERRLTAILAADIAGYSALMGADEARTVRDLKGHQAVLLPMIDTFGGRIIDTAGDGILAEFASVVNAVKCAVSIQKTMAERNAAIEVERRMQLRIGINIGDVIYDDARIFGDGVNIANRIEGLSDAGGICISAAAYDQIRGKTEHSFEDAGEHLVKNIKEPVHIYRMPRCDSPQITQTGAVGQAQPRRRKASVAVLPFDNLSDDQQMNLVTEGLVEDILTGLQRFRLVSVISRNSSSRLKGRYCSAAEILEELKADYFIEGSIRKAAGFARVTVQLIESRNDEHLWARRFDRPLDNPFDLQDEVSSAVIAALEPVLIDAEVRRGILLEPGYFRESNLKRATWHLYRFTKADCDKAIDLLEKAVAENANASGRHEALAMGYLWRLTFGWAEDPKATIAQALTASQQATDLAQDDAYKHAVRAWALLWGGSANVAMSEIERAQELNPHSAVTSGVKAFIAGHLGRPDVAIEAIQESLALSKETPFLFQYATGAALAYFARKDWHQQQSC